MTPAHRTPADSSPALQSHFIQPGTRSIGIVGGKGDAGVPAARAFLDSAAAVRRLCPSPP